jgi:hypothetical protein
MMIALAGHRDAAYVAAMVLCVAWDYLQHPQTGAKQFLPYHCFSQARYKVYLLCPQHGPVSRLLCDVHHAEAQQEGEMTYKECGLPVSFVHAIELHYPELCEPVIEGQRV